MILSPCLVALVLLPHTLSASPPIHIPLNRRNTANRIANLPKAVDALRVKYGYKSKNLAKRDSTSTSVPLTDESNDISYSARVKIGTPPQEFDVSLDTGSSDFWIATNQCTTCTSGISLFDPSASSTFKASTSSANITYGAGSVQGTISQDTVSLGTLTVPKQTLLAATQPTPNLMQYGLSGIMGLAFMPISAMKAYPFWENLVNNELANNVMSFYLERYVDQSTDISTAPGGTFILGGINSSLYTGEIEFLPVPQPTGPTPSYWMLEVSAMTVQGKSITVPDNSLAAIDTGTTLIAAPSATVQSLWATVPGSQPLTGDYEGLYAFPCSTDVSVSISFGGTAWAINTKDMNLGSVDVTTTGPMSGIVDAASSGSQMCVGAIFDIGSSVGSGPGAPSWVIGDTFLKNVYTVLQGGTPLHIGFAHLPSDGSKSPFPNAAPSSKIVPSLALVAPLIAGLVIAF